MFTPGTRVIPQSFISATPGDQVLQKKGIYFGSTIDEIPHLRFHSSIRSMYAPSTKSDGNHLITKVRSCSNLTLYPAGNIACGMKMLRNLEQKNQVG